MKKKDIVLKIGGSLLYDENLKLNILFISKVKRWLKKNVSNYRKIVLVTGGGLLSRDMQKKVEDNLQTEDDIHGIAMQVTVLNAQILKELFDQKDYEIVVPKSLGELFEAINSENIKIIICGGLKKGWSTDMDAVVSANILGLDRVYKISKVEGVYDKDPSVNKDAKFIKEITWNKYFDLFDIDLENNTHIPNRSMPVDSLTAQYCAERDISVFISGGEDIEKTNDIASLFEEGTFIHS